MKFGLAISKGFVSVLCISYFMVISFVCNIQFMILENRIQFYQDIKIMDQRVYFEVLIIHRIKDSYTQKLLDNCVLYYEDIKAEVTYLEDCVVVEYSYDDVIYKREYVYNEEDGSLRIITG